MRFVRWMEPVPLSSEPAGGTLGRASGSPPRSIVPLVFHEHVPSSNKVWWGGPGSQGPAGRMLCRCQGSSRARAHAGAYEGTRGERFIGGETPEGNAQLAEEEEMKAFVGGHLGVPQPRLRSRERGKTVGPASPCAPTHDDCPHLVTLASPKSRGRIVKFPHEL